MEKNPKKSQTNRDLSSKEASKNEEILVKGLREKQEWAFKEIIDRWADKLYQIAFRFVRQEELAHEVLQEVFKKVLEKIHTFKGESKLYTWLYRVTVNEALMNIRSSMKTKETISWEEILPHYEEGIVADLSQYGDWSKLPETKLMEKEAREFIQQCIEQLPEDYQAPYILKDVEQLSEQEVSDTLGISKSIMKIRVHRARMFIRKKLEERYVV